MSDTRNGNAGEVTSDKVETAEVDCGTEMLVFDLLPPLLKKRLDLALLPISAIEVYTIAEKHGKLAAYRSIRDLEFVVTGTTLENLDPRWNQD